MRRITSPVGRSLPACPSSLGAPTSRRLISPACSSPAHAEGGHPCVGPASADVPPAPLPLPVPPPARAEGGTHGRPLWPPLQQLLPNRQPANPLSAGREDRVAERRSRRWQRWLAQPGGIVVCR